MTKEQREAEIRIEAQVMKARHHDLHTAMLVDLLAEIDRLRQENAKLQQDLLAEADAFQSYKERIVAPFEMNRDKLAKAREALRKIQNVNDCPICQASNIARQALKETE